MAKSLEIDEQPRLLRYGEAERDPVALVLGLMRADQQTLDDLLRAVAVEQFELAHAWREAAIHVQGDTANEWQAVEIIVHRLADLLGQYHVATEDPTGAVWCDEMRPRYDLIGYTRREDIQVPRVAHVGRPLVLRHGRVIGKGSVTVDAPTPKTPASPPSPQGPGE